MATDAFNDTPRRRINPDRLVSWLTILVGAIFVAFLIIGIIRSDDAPTTPQCLETNTCDYGAEF